VSSTKARSGIFGRISDALVAMIFLSGLVFVVWRETSHPGVPIYPRVSPPAQDVQKLTGPGDSNVSAIEGFTFSTLDAPDKVYTWYEGQLAENGWGPAPCSLRGTRFNSLHGSPRVLSLNVERIGELTQVRVVLSPGSSGCGDM
jgi:hypothetical protein